MATKLIPEILKDMFLVTIDKATPPKPKINKAAVLVCHEHQELICFSFFLLLICDGHTKTLIA